MPPTRKRGPARHATPCDRCAQKGLSCLVGDHAYCTECHSARRSCSHYMPVTRTDSSSSSASTADYGGPSPGASAPDAGLEQPAASVEAGGADEVVASASTSFSSALSSIPNCSIAEDPLPTQVASSTSRSTRSASAAARRQPAAHVVADSDHLPDWRTGAGGPLEGQIRHVSLPCRFRRCCATC